MFENLLKAVTQFFQEVRELYFKEVEMLFVSLGEFVTECRKSFRNALVVFLTSLSVW